MNFAFEFLKKSQKEGRLVHAYLFFGGNLSEKVETAKGFAKLLLGDDVVTARLIDTDEHANVVNIRPDGKNIKKEQIVFLKDELGKKSLEDKAKVYIIEDAQQMSISATNSLLKFLEEPAPDVYIILIAPAREGLLPTILSRCIGLGFKSDQSAKPVICPEILTIIQQIELGATFHLLVAKNGEIFKERTPEFLTALSRFYRNQMATALQQPVLLQRYVNYLKAIETAQQNLRYNMNIQLCLDQLAIVFSAPRS